ncbi:MAG TPA: protein-glutamate O-methyltransferase CheR [Candidatus Baltobacteraceae bacterium]|nr:protein-glutamate O-methyltransferase CheR [Candidatus Baltobacteraceae bacterium]
MSTIAISETEFHALRDLIRERFGIYYDDTKQFLLQSRLQTRLLKCRINDFAGYERYLTASPERETEWSELASVLSNNETYFFRERAQLEVLVAEVLDEAHKAGTPLRVWSSACSTGEEPYTIGMMLMQTHRVAPSHVVLRATDLSPRALERAATGFYRELSFRATPPEMVQRYFRPFEGGFFINDEIKRMVEFSRLNLLDERAVAAMGTFDAVFCRNVLIYFEKPTQKRVVEAFAKVLRPGGFLFLGHAESIMRITDCYEPVVTPKAIYYRRK